MIDGRPVALVGFMAAGKTSVGPQLAMRLGLEFVDLDAELVVQEGASVPELFESRGEAGFRELESALLERRLGTAPAVIATGGGIVEIDGNRRRLAERAEVVWLDVRFETVLSRLADEENRERPLAVRLGREGLRTLHRRRRPLYASCSDLRVDADRDAPGRIARRIALHLRRAAEHA